MSGERFDARLLDDIWLRPVGTVATADHAAGDTTLYVGVGGDLQDWDPDGDEPLEMIRGYVLITPADVADADPVDPFVVAYWDWDGELDEQEYVVLATGLPVAVPAGSTVWVWNPDLTLDPTGATGEVVSEWVGPVMRDDEESSLDDDDNDTLILPDLVDTLSAANVPDGGIPVIVETLESFYGPEKAQELGVTGDDDKYVTTVIGGDLVRDGSKTPMTQHAFDRSEGTEPAALLAGDPNGARIEVKANEGGGFVRMVDADGVVRGVLRVIIDETGKAVCTLASGTGGAASRLRSWVMEDGTRRIDAIADQFISNGIIIGTNSLTLQLSPTLLKGFDGNSNVSRVLSSEGTTTVPHMVAGGGTVHVNLRGGNSRLFDIDVAQVTGSDVTFAVTWRRAGDGHAGGDPAVNETVTFDWSIRAYDRPTPVV